MTPALLLLLPVRVPVPVLRVDIPALPLPSTPFLAPLSAKVKVGYCKVLGFRSWLKDRLDAAWSVLVESPYSWNPSYAVRPSAASSSIGT